jgi:hypothetical protein
MTHNIATCVKLRVRFTAGERDFLSPTASTQAVELTQPPIERVWGAFSPGIRRSVHETKHSLSSSVEVKNA